MHHTPLGCKHKTNPIMAITLQASNGTAILYPQSHLIECGGRLFRTPYSATSDLVSFQFHNTNAITLHTKNVFILDVESNHPTDKYDWMVVVCTTDNSREYKKDNYVDNINHKWRRVQRWMLAHTKSLLTRKKLAVCMALHPRLGIESKIASLGLDCINEICSFIKGARDQNCSKRTLS